MTSYSYDLPDKIACHEDKWVEKVISSKSNCIASSILPAEGTINYLPINLFDGKKDTCWCPDNKKEKNGIDSFVIFKIPFGIKGIRIINGAAINNKTFYENNRIKKLYIGIINKHDIGKGEIYLCPKINKYSLTYNTISDELIELKDTKEKQDVYFDKFIKWNDDSTFKYKKDIFIIVGIIDVYKGGKYNDTCLSEIELIR